MNRIETRTISGDGLINLPKLMRERAQLNETNKAFIAILGETIIIKRQHGPDERPTLRTMVLDMVYALPSNVQFDITCTLFEHLSELLEKEEEGIESQL